MIHGVWKIVSFVLPMVGLLGCGDVSRRFELIPAEASGVTFENQLTPTVDLNILSYLYYYNGGGVAASDFNDDGLTDLYFTGNQVPDKLYLNKGDFEFEDVTTAAGIANQDGWTTGVSHVDINGDGLMDIYVCKVGKYQSIIGRNLLYVNQGVSEEGVSQFKEEAKAYGLDISSFATKASFFDYDLDNDLDLFVLNHSVHPNRTYGKGQKRQLVDTLAGDILFENRNGRYVDVTRSAGLHQGVIGYGLGVSTSDLNDDGYPDIYVGNDFFENDYLYLNNTDGTFEEVISSDQNPLGHTTHYSMGNSIVDINNDGKMDILSLDMLPQDLETYKTSGLEFSYPIYRYYLSNGYRPQYMQNTLHLGLGQERFQEVAFLSGIASTEWSWSVLAQDYDMDGIKDIYITNGILGATNDMDFISFVAQEHIQKDISEGDPQMLDFVVQLPQKKISNYAYRGLGNNKFEDVSHTWFEELPNYSNGAAYADLDNDGDLDIIVNVLNEAPLIYRNNSFAPGKHFLTVDLAGPEKNTNGVGAKVLVYSGGLFLLQENFPDNAYLSAVPTNLTFGLGTQEKIDSLVVIWPDGTFESRFDLPVDQTITFDYNNASGFYYKSSTNRKTPDQTMGIQLEFTHVENPSLDFDRDPLIPFAKGNEGPKLAIGDVDADGLEDVYIGGAKWQPGALLLQQQDGNFVGLQEELWTTYAKNEETDQVFFDADGDDDLDLVIVSGGNEFSSGQPVRPLFFENENGRFKARDAGFEELEVNASVVKAFDIDRDGDNDLIIGSNTVPKRFGKQSINMILINDGSGFFEDKTDIISPDFRDVGLVEDLVILDMDGNGFEDVVAVGHWMPVSIFLNYGKELIETAINSSNGWWNCVAAADFDGDGDFDLVAGNWGLNTRLSASQTDPVTLYRYDFDGNGKVDPILTYIYQGVGTTLASKDELVKQLPMLNKDYLSYKDFAQASLEDLFGKKKLDQAEKKLITELATCYFENTGDSFVKRKLPFGAQVSSVQALFLDDFNTDGSTDIFMVGNSYEISTQLGRLDALHGQVLLNDKKGFFNEMKDQRYFVSGAARDIAQINIKGVDHLIITINNDKPIVLRKEEMYE